MPKTKVGKIPACPMCGKSYGVNVRKDGTIRCRLCGYEGKISLTGGE